MMHSNTSFEPVSCDNFYLTDVSSKDKPWDIHREQADSVMKMYYETLFNRYAERISTCSQLLEFMTQVDSETAEIALKLNHTHFCRVRHCPVCQWRKSLKWRARFFEAMPKILEAYPTARFVFLTLTLQNCHVTDLKATVATMNKAWKRFSERSGFPAIGWLKSLEVTREYTCTSPSTCSYKALKKRCPNCSPTQYAHPHFHAFLMVNASYFGEGYLSQEKWTQMWKESLRVNYTPVVHVKAVKPKKGLTVEDTQEQIAKALCETIKYSVKPEDLASDAEWLIELTSQLHKTRSISLGGAFKQFVSEEEPEDLIHNEEEKLESVGDIAIRFWWYELAKRYVKCQGTD